MTAERALAAVGCMFVAALVLDQGLELWRAHQSLSLWRRLRGCWRTLRGRR